MKSTVNDLHSLSFFQGTNIKHSEDIDCRCVYKRVLVLPVTTVDCQKRSMSEHDTFLLRILIDGIISKSIEFEVVFQKWTAMKSRRILQ